MTVPRKAAATRGKAPAKKTTAKAPAKAPAKRTTAKKLAAVVGVTDKPSRPLKTAKAPAKKTTAKKTTATPPAPRAGKPRTAKKAAPLPLRAIRVSDRDWKAAQRRAKRDGVSVSEVCRQALAEYARG